MTQPNTLFILRNGQVSHLYLPVSYPIGKVPINSKKINDLRKLPYLVGYKGFFNDILEWPICEEDTGND